MDTVWGLISVLAIAGVGLLGIPFLGRGGGLLRGRRRRRGRGDYRIKVGPSAPALLAAALLRRLDTVLLVAVSTAFLVLIVLNARA